MRLIFATLALLLAAIVPAAALDLSALDGRVVDEAHLLDHVQRHALEQKLADLETRTSKKLVVITISSAPGATVEGYGLELRKQWGVNANGNRVALIVSPNTGRSVIQFDRGLSETLPESITDTIFQQVLNPRIRSGDFAGGVTAASDSIIKVLGGEKLPDMRPAQAPQRFAQSEVTVPATSEFPALSSRVVDAAGILDSSTRESLRAKLAALEAKTGDQLVVATVRSLNGSSIEDYSNRLFRSWQLGQKGKNNGVLLIVAPNDRKVRIEVGYGLEGTLTDAISKFIIQNAIVPRFKANDFGGGIVAAVNDLIKVLSGDEEFKGRASAPQPVWSWSRMTSSEQTVVLIFIPLVLFIIGMAVVGGRGKKRPRKGFWSGVGDWSQAGYSGSYSSSSSSWGSSSSGSSDSFSGGGGDSGGGGASGDW